MEIGMRALEIAIPVGDGNKLPLRVFKEDKFAEKHL